MGLLLWGVLSQWVSWDVHLLLVAVAVGLSQVHWEQEAGGEHADFDSHSSYRRVQESWEALLFVDTFQEALEQVLLANHEVGVEHVIHIVLAIPYTQEERHSPDTFVEACGHGQAAFHRVACRQVYAVC